MILGISTDKIMCFTKIFNENGLVNSLSKDFAQAIMIETYFKVGLTTVFGLGILAGVKN